jgi:chemotaxis protein MotB
MITRPKRHKRKLIEDVNNQDRWMVSYADFITLLFAFFVVMYSISSVNEGKYKSLTHSLGSAFSVKSSPAVELDSATPFLLDSPITVFKPMVVDNPALMFKPILVDNVVAKPLTPIAPNAPAADADKKRELSEGLIQERKQLKQVSEQLETALGTFIDDNLVSVKRNDYWITLEMNSELLFLSGEAALSKKAQPVLEKIAQVINPLPNAVNVEGHTDDKPINTRVFPSNWELSSARATRVVQALVKAGINPTRLSAIGYGEFHPLDDNATEEGRFNNRRVILVLMSQAFSRYGANDEERAKLLNLMPTAALAAQHPSGR